MKITQFSDQYLDEMAALFALSFSEPGREFDLPTAKAYLERSYRDDPSYSLMAVTDDEEIMGAIFCSITPYYRSQILLVDVLQVKKKYRAHGVGKKLLAEAIRKAKEAGCFGVHFLADERVSFPKGWYERLGFEKTHWVEYEAALEDIAMDELDGGEQNGE